jgi:hypothetical protein
MQNAKCKMKVSLRDELKSLPLEGKVAKSLILTDEVAPFIMKILTVA